MQATPLKNVFQRIMVIAVALLISNVAALTCALAMEICSDCPEEPPAHCIEMFDDSTAVSVEKQTGETSATRLDNNPSYTTSLPSTPHKKAAATSVAIWPPNAVYSPPQINLLNCVFLK